jgi:hypothetical protein
MRSPHLLALLLLLTSVGYAQKVRPVQDGDLFFNVIPQRNTLTSADTLLLKVEITNIGHDVVLIAMDDVCLNPEAGLSLSVTDQSSKPVKMSVPLTCIPDSSATDRERFIRLPPDAIFGRLIRLQGSRIASKPGDYFLTFTLRGTMRPAQIAQMFHPPSASPAAKSTPITAFCSQSTPMISKIPIHLQP